MNYVLSIDVGTSSVRAALYDTRGRLIPGVVAAEPHEPDATADGGSEMDAEGLLQRSIGCVERVLALAGDRASAISGVGVGTFWHSILGVDGDGWPATPVLMWSDTRSVEEVEILRRALDVTSVHQRTGCVQHTSYVPPRLLWVSRRRPDWFERSARWMSPGEYFALRLFGRTACGVSMASGTGMFDHGTGTWDRDVLAALPIRPEQLSPIVDSTEPFTGLTEEFASRMPALRGVPWFPAAGDGACSSVGSGCVSPDRVALMAGTSGAVRVMRDVMDEGENGTVPEGLWRYRWDRRRFLVGGALSNGGSLFAWMRETLLLPEAGALEEALAQVAPDGHGLTVLPFLAGERCPGWRGDARAAIVGLSSGTRPIDIVRAGLEAVAYRFALIHDLLRPAAAPGHRIVASGGALLASPAWIQLIADAIGEPVVSSDEEQASARGAALLALEGVGSIRDLGESPARFGEIYEPDPERHALYREARGRQARLYDALIARDWTAPPS